MRYLLQTGDYMRKEKLAITRTNLPCVACSYDELSELEGADYIPVGTVEYVNEYCRVKNITPPTNISYPVELVKFLNRSVWQSSYSFAKEYQFVKPRNTKVFTGAVKKDIEETVKDDEPVWISDPMTFTAEFRFYIIENHIAGYSRYDDGDDNIQPDINTVQQMITEYTKSPIGYVLDVGPVDNKTVLIEVNDGWSLGYYPWGTMTTDKYVELITKRWCEIVQECCSQVREIDAMEIRKHFGVEE